MHAALLPPTHTRTPSRRQRYVPRLERLEDRLPPGLVFDWLLFAWSNDVAGDPLPPLPAAPLTARQQTPQAVEPGAAASLRVVAAPAAAPDRGAMLSAVPASQRADFVAAADPLAWLDQQTGLQEDPLLSLTAFAGVPQRAHTVRHFDAEHAADRADQQSSLAPTPAREATAHSSITPILAAPEDDAGRLLTTLAQNQLAPPKLTFPKVGNYHQATEGVVRFGVIGDYGSIGFPEYWVAEMVKSWVPDFVVTTGDNNYPDGAALTALFNIGWFYCDFIHNPDAPWWQRCPSGLPENRFFPVLGNHDWNTTSGGLPRPYLDYFTLPGNERYYEVTRGPVQIFAIDSDSAEPDGTTSTSVQAQWLRQRLAASDATWKLVVFHHPPYSSGDHGSTARMQWPFQEWGASAVLTGHDHTYERVERDNFPYFVNGLGGNPGIYNFGTPVPGSAVRYRGNWGAQYVEATADYIAFYFVNIVGEVIDVRVIERSGGAPTPGRSGGPGLAADTALVPFGAVWKYLDNGTDQGAAWRNLGFNDTAWASGPAQLGYGDGDEATVVGYGPDPDNKYITTYFRHAFDVPDPSFYQSLQLWLLRDDGAVVYLNGNEIYRSNMPASAVDYQTPASVAVGGDEESEFFFTAVPASFLVPGNNVLAIEIHQSSGQSSDISFEVGMYGSEVVRFAVIGDFGLAGPAELAVSYLVKAMYPDFVVTTGDNNYPNGELSTIHANIGQYYCPFIRNPDAPLSPPNLRCNAGLGVNRFYPSLGNHDWDSTTGSAPYRSYFTLPGNERYYDTTWGNVHLIALDVDPREPDGRSSTSVQGVWAQQRLAASTARWKIVFMHHPPYSSSSSHGSTPILQWPYQAWGASVVLAGHDHTYERIVLNDFPYFVNGLGGNPGRYGFGTPIPGSVARYNANWGAMYVEASPYYLFLIFISVDGTYFDWHLVL